MIKITLTNVEQEIALGSGGKMIIQNQSGAPIQYSIIRGGNVFFNLEAEDIIVVDYKVWMKAIAGSGEIVVGKF